MEVKEVRKKRSDAAESSFESSHYKMPPITLRPRRNWQRRKLDSDLRSLDSIHVAGKVLTSADMLSPFPAKLGLPDLSSEDDEEDEDSSPRMVPTPFYAHEIGNSNSNSSSNSPSPPSFRSPSGPDEELLLAQDDHQKQSSKRSRDVTPRRLFFLESSFAAQTDLPRPRPRRAEDTASAPRPAFAAKSLHFSSSSAFNAKRRKTATA